VVYENAKAGTAYVVESKLNVMLEQDYLALSHSERSEESKDALRYFVAKTAPQDDKGVNALGSQIVREVVIPELTKEVNETRISASCVRFTIVSSWPHGIRRRSRTVF